MRFKTNAKCGGCSTAIITSLSTLAPASDWQMDLASPDKILTYTGAAKLKSEDIISIVRGAGFQIEEIAD